MDNSEMLYEISLKYNTLKMYENTLEQMIKNGVSSDESIARIEQEKQAVESELIELLNPKTEVVESGKKSPSIGDSNKFIQAQKKAAEYKKLYSAKNGSFFDSITKNADDSNKTHNLIEEKKPTFADIQDKISNSKWISCSNFIVRFPKNLIDIDEWRISGVDYEIFRPETDESRVSGRINIFVNDFADKNGEYNYNILMKSIIRIYKTHSFNGNDNIKVDVIDNGGEELYSILFKDCEFSNAYIPEFSYDKTDLRKICLEFFFNDIIVLAPNEKYRLNETAN